jgi:hypothetical protein
MGKAKAGDRDARTILDIGDGFGGARDYFIHKLETIH